MLRFPYLKEGDTREKRDGIRAWMQTHDYRPAPVSIDTSDWYYNQVFLKLLASGNTAAQEALIDAYARHLLDRAGYYDRLAIRVVGRSPAHVMLLHVNALNSVAMDRVVKSFRDGGWRFVAPERAFSDSLYSAKPDVLPAGESIVWSLAKKSGVAGLRYPAEDSVYEEPALEALLAAYTRQPPAAAVDRHGFTKHHQQQEAGMIEAAETAPGQQR